MSFCKRSCLLIRASVSKTRNRTGMSRFSVCFPEWLRLYRDKVPNKPPTPDSESCEASRSLEIRDARARYYKAAGGIGSEPQNSKRRTCASNHIALHEDYDKLSLQLGHTHSAMSLQYVGGVTKQQATEYFDIRPKLTCRDSKPFAASKDINIADSSRPLIPTT